MLSILLNVKCNPSAKSIQPAKSANRPSGGADAGGGTGTSADTKKEPGCPDFLPRRSALLNSLYFTWSIPLKYRQSYNMFILSYCRAKVQDFSRRSSYVSGTCLVRAALHSELSFRSLCSWQMRSPDTACRIPPSCGHELL